MSSASHSYCVEFVAENRHDKTLSQKRVIDILSHHFKLSHSWPCVSCLIEVCPIPILANAHRPGTNAMKAEIGLRCQCKFSDLERYTLFLSKMEVSRTQS